MTASPTAAFLRFEGLDGAPVRHAVSTRPWNVSFSAGVEHGDPIEGRRRLLEFAGIDAARTVIAGQVHGTRVRWIDEVDCGPGALARGHAIAETDALATVNPGIGLVVTAADCPSILILDAAAPALAVVHSGWRGTAGGILPKTIDALEAKGARRERLTLAIGPGIGPCCYEVGDDVAARVPAALRARVLTSGSSPGRSRLDLRAWILAQAAEAGVAPRRIHHLDFCTACRRDLFYSHRAERGRCGRFGLAAALR